MSKQKGRVPKIAKLTGIRALVTLPPLERADWLVSLDRLVGLDDSLDRLGAQLRTSRGTDIVAEILERLSALV